MVSLAAAIMAIAACEDFHIKKNDPDQVLTVYSLGYNNLAGYLQEDIRDLEDSYASVGGNNAVIIFSHKTKQSYDYATPNPPVIIELTKDRKGSVIRDTLMAMDKNTVGTSGETLNKVLTFIKERYPEAEHSILFTSHGTGWAPADYCNEPDRYETDLGETDWLMRKVRMGRTPYWGIIPEDGSPAVKSFGVQNMSKDTYLEMDINEMADAFPMKMKSMIFDACFMGAVEVAYELRNVTEMLVASQTEILADGMDYETMLSYIFKKDSDLKGFCENYFNYYNRLSGDSQSATISLVDCSKLEPLAEICREIFDSQREEIAALEGSMSIQRYYRLRYAYNHKWFYDLEDIIAHSGISQEQKDRLDAALEECIVYKATTEEFMNEITINTHCGLSMYLPYASHTYLNDFYKTLEWNKATGLVQ